MKEITLFFSGLGFKDINQAKVCIYNINGDLIKATTTYNGRIDICLKVKTFYKIIAISKYETINKVIYFNNDNIYLSFSNSLLSNDNLKLTTFYLTDYNYPNLPIEKGTMIFG